MPKIIENLKERLLAEAGRQLKSGGYESVTIRSIAKGCDVGVGTVYNYFPSKDALIAGYMLEDWLTCVDRMQSAAGCSDSPQPVIRCIYDQLAGFYSRYDALFHDAAASSGFTGAFGRYHERLRLQLAQPLRRYCHDDFTAQFIAESMLTWTIAGKGFDELYEILKKIM